MHWLDSHLAVARCRRPCGPGRCRRRSRAASSPHAELQAGLAAADDRDACAFSPSCPPRSRPRAISSVHQQRYRRLGALRPHRGVAAVDAHVGAGDEARIVGQQERHRFGDLGRDCRCGRAEWNGFATPSVLARLPLVNSTMMLLQVQPGETALTRMPSGARSIAWLRVSCRMAALQTGIDPTPGLRHARRDRAEIDDRALVLVRDAAAPPASASPSRRD